MTYVTVLEHKRAEVARDLESLRQEVTRLSGEVAVREAQLRNLDDLLSFERGGALPEAADDRTAKGHFLDAAFQLVSGTPEGLHYRDLLDQMTALGVRVPGQDPAANLIAHLTRDERFVRTARGTYGAKGTHREATATRRRRARR